MTFAILGGGQLDTGYTIDNSLRFNQSDDPSLTRTPASVSNRRTFTWSGWVKRSKINATRQLLFGADNSADTNATYIRLTDDETIQVYIDNNNVLEGNLNTSAKFRDVSAWYHIVWAVDTTQSTSSDRVKVYINGSLVTSYQTPVYPSQNFDTNINTQEPHYVGGDTTGVANDYALDGYLAETHFIDGQQLSPTSFGEFDAYSGIWKPIQYSGSYGTNGFYLDFENSGSLGADQSGNGNNFTPTNLASTDQMQDTPTNNFCTMNQLHYRGSVTFAQGNLRINLGSSSSVAGTHSVNSGKWYFEAKLQSGSETMVGWINPDISTFYTGNTFEQAGNVLYYSGNGNLYKYGGSLGYGASYSAGTIIGCALDLDNNQVTFYKNGVSQGAASINAGNYIPYLITGGNSANWSMCFSSYDFSVASGNSDANGYGNFEYAPPSGYLALCTQNLATELPPTIDDGSQYFNTILWTGSGTSSSRSLTGVGFQPDWIWIKPRTSNPNATHHQLYDSNRGTGKSLRSSSSETEITNSAYGYLSSFDSDGFSSVAGVNNNENINETGATFVAWNWKANAGSTSSNTDGSITSTVQANTTAGFSIVTYTGNGTAGATVGHGLGVTPDMFIIKGRDQSGSWVTYHKTLGATKALALQGTNAPTTSSAYFNNTEPTSSVFSLGYDGPGNEVNNSGTLFVAYCFADIEGYSKFGSYTGNASDNGSFAYTGFRPAWVMYKNASIGTAGAGWHIWDNKRNTFNVVDNYLLAQSSNAEGNFDSVDFTSNGFKLRVNDNGQNGSGNTIIYMAFAENPFVSSTGVPVVAR